MGEKLCRACFHGSFSLVSSLLANPLSDYFVNYKDITYGNFPLYNAAYNGSVSCVEALLEHKKIKINLVSNNNRSTALHAATFKKKTKIIEILLKAGASTSIRNDKRLLAEEEGGFREKEIYLKYTNPKKRSTEQEKSESITEGKSQRFSGSKSTNFTISGKSNSSPINRVENNDSNPSLRKENPNRNSNTHLSNPRESNSPTNNNFQTINNHINNIQIPEVTLTSTPLAIQNNNDIDKYDNQIDSKGSAQNSPSKFNPSPTSGLNFKENIPKNLSNSNNNNPSVSFCNTSKVT
jgi:hypothetical protein